MEHPKKDITEEEFEKDKQEILRMLKQGMSINRIRQAFKFPQKYLIKIVDSLISEGLTTEEEIRKAETRGRSAQTVESHKADIEIIKKHIQSGKTIADIAKEYRRSHSYISRLIKESKANGEWLTDEQEQEIRKNRERKILQKKEAEQREKQRQKEKKKRERLQKAQEQREKKKRERQQQIAEQHKADIEKIKRHIKSKKTITDIAREMGCSREYIYRLIRQSKENGEWITDEQIDQGRENTENKKERRRQQIEEKHKADIEKIKEYIQAGKTIKNIAGEMGFSREYIYRLIKQSKENGEWLTEEQEQERKVVIQTKRQQKREFKQREKNKQKEAIKRENIVRFRWLVEEGYSIQEIADKMNYTVQYMYTLKKQCIDQGLWFSEESLEQFRKERNIREGKKAERAKRTEEKRLENERRELELKVKQQEALHRDMEAQRNIKIRELMDSIKISKKKAKKEFDMELDEPTRVSTIGRRKFLSCILELHKLSGSIAEDNKKLAIDIICTCPELATKGLLKMLIMDSFKMEGINGSIKTINQLTRTLNGTEFYEYLVNYKDWVKKTKVENDIKRLKAEGKNNTEVAQLLNISSAEVAIIWEDGVGPAPDER